MPLPVALYGPLAKGTLMVPAMMLPPCVHETLSVTSAFTKVTATPADPSAKW